MESDSAGKAGGREAGGPEELNLAPEDQCLWGEVGYCPLAAQFLLPETPEELKELEESSL